MQVAGLQRINSYNSFRAQEVPKSTNVLYNVLNRGDKLDLQTKKLQGALGRCLGTVLLVDIVYFMAKFCSKKA